MRQVLAWMLFCALALSGCPKPGPGISQPATQQSGLEMLQALGDGAPLVLVVKPGLWSPGSGNLKPVLDLLSVPSEAAARILGAPDLWIATIEAASVEAPVDWPRALPGWDSRRPVGIALGEAMPEDLALPFRAFLGDSGGRDLSGLRHRVLLPATDPAKLLESLQRLLSAMKLVPVADPRGELAPKGGKVFALPGSGFVALLPGDRQVRIEILTSEFRPGRGDAARFDEWKRILSRKPAEVRLAGTPAQLFLADSRDLVVAYLRPWRLRASSMQREVVQILDAVTDADPCKRTALLGQGLAEVLSGYRWMSPEGAEFDDVAVGLSTRGGVRLRAVASLTELGERVYQPGATRAGLESKPVEEGTLIRVTLPFNLGAALDQAALPPALQEVQSLDELDQLVQECGLSCYAHALLRNPAGILKAMGKLINPAWRRHLPLNLEAVLTDLVPDPPEGSLFLKAALVADFPKGYDPSDIKTFLSLLERGGGLRRNEAPFLRESKPDRETLQVGFNLDPRKAFCSPAAPQVPGLLAEVEIDLAGLAKAIGPLDPSTFALLGEPVTARGRVVQSGHALIVEALLEKKGEPPQAFSAVTEDHSSGRTSPGLAEARSAGRRCLDRVAAGMRTAFHAWAVEVPDKRDGLLARTLEEMKAPLECAMREPDARAQASGIQEAMTLFRAYHLSQEFRFDERIAVLKEACAQGLQVACRQAKEWQATPAVRLGEGAFPCTASTLCDFQIATLTKSGEAVGLPAPGGRHPLILLADREARFGAVLGAIQKLPEVSLELAFLYPEKGLRALPILHPTPAHLLSGYGNFLPLKLKVLGKAVQIEGPGGTMDIEPPGPCRQTACPELLEAVLASLRKIREPFGERVLVFLDLAADSSWQDAVVLLSSTACAKSDESSGAFQVILGPPPREFWEKTKAQRP